jgi:hypothetical protein
MRSVLPLAGFLTIVCLLHSYAHGQTKRAKAPKPAAAAPSIAVGPPEIPSSSPKRNERPQPSNPVPVASVSETLPPFEYELHHPGFVYHKIVIKHDDKGVGTISFLKEGYEELFTDPITLSKGTLDAINNALDTLNFLDSKEEYQTARDYSHMGTMRLTVRRSGRARSVSFNYTENKAAKTLADVYRKIGNEYTWRFEFGIARENQPLQTPSLMNTLDILLQRGEISDPPHLIPTLTELSTDERLPLMARNHALKLLKVVGKQKK